MQCDIACETALYRGKIFTVGPDRHQRLILTELSVRYSHLSFTNESKKYNCVAYILICSYPPGRQAVSHLEPCSAPTPKLASTASGVSAPAARTSPGAPPLGASTPIAQPSCWRQARPPSRRFASRPVDTDTSGNNRKADLRNGSLETGAV